MTLAHEVRVEADQVAGGQLGEQRNVEERFGLERGA
jgi:hypothetical protein